MSGKSVVDIGVEGVREYLELRIPDYDDYDELRWEATRYDAPYNGLIVEVHDDGGDVRLFTVTIKEYEVD